MPREKDFDQQMVVKKCINLFANKGYSATGIQEIVEATNINRSSLYSTFKGKDELFLTCLKKVMLDEVTILEALQKKGHSATKLLDAYLELVIKDKPGFHLLKYANAEFNLLNKKTQALVNIHYQWKYTFFEGIIKLAQKDDKLTKKIDAKDMVGLLELIVQGIQNVAPLANAEKIYKKSVLQFSTLIKKKK